MKIEELISLYRSNESEIRKREESFSGFLERSSENRVFAELAFCLLTPQSNAVKCWGAVKDMQKNRVLFDGAAGEISCFIACARFKNNKARYISEAREFFSGGGRMAIKEKLAAHKTPTERREMLVENVTGMGMKEASHFLRNAGIGAGLAILDRHILKNLEALKVVEAAPASLTKKAYLDLEARFNDFAGRIGIPPGQLDLLLWFRQTGFFFK